jgi:hypothetical protein
MLQTSTFGPYFLCAKSSGAKIKIFKNKMTTYQPHEVVDSTL